MAGRAASTSSIQVNTGSSSVDDAVALVIVDVLRRRAAGEVVPDEQVIAEHSELMPRLGAELAALPHVRRAYLSARKAGALQSRLHILDDQQLEAPITVSDGDAPVVARNRATSIEGYHIIGEIGCGGQGTVFKAVQECTGRTVAIKVMLGGALAGSRHRARFEREIAIMATIDHPNIVEVIDRGCTADGSFFFVMRYVNGAPLDEYLADYPRLHDGDAAEMLGLWIKIARAVHEAHRHGIVHRDLKPSNILVDQRGEPHVMDFGLARPSADLAGANSPAARTLTGQIIGSLPWTSPEQAGADPDRLSVRSDVYSLGVVFYQVLTGHFPYPIAGAVTQVLKNIASATPRPPSRMMPARWNAAGDHRHGFRVRGGGPAAALDAILLKALAKDPEQRYESAGALADELENYLAGRPTVAMPAGSIGGLPRRRAFLVAAMLLCCVLGIAWWANHQSPHAASYMALPTTTNSIGMRFVRLTPRTFIMGSPESEEGHRPDERQREVRIERAVFMGVTEVTQGQFRAIMDDNPSMGPPGDDLPVQNVSWEDAVEFCRKLSVKENRSYRLPSEVEWEYACRAGSKQAFAGSGVIDEMGWYEKNSDRRPHPVAGKLSNAWGLYDMHGGVAEWCADRYDQRPASEITAPQADAAGADRSILRVVRGGDITQPAAACRCASRSFLAPRLRLPTIGFRVVLEEVNDAASATGK